MFHFFLEKEISTVKTNCIEKALKDFTDLEYVIRKERALYYYFAENQ